jgi:predicted nucleotide-binding protein (sugar kinase/HSP70/actin superfamily)
MVIIGIPRAGRQGYFITLYKTFFEELGFKVVISPETTKEIVDNGVKHSETDFCFAIKIYIGHILWLKDKADYIFIPSMFGLRPYFCAYHAALPDLIRTVDPEVKMITSTIDEDGNGLFESLKQFNKSKKEMEKALEKAKQAWKEEKTYEVKKEEEKLKSKKPKIAIIGADDYISRDKFCLMNIPELLEKNGIETIIFDHFKYTENFKPGFKIQWIIEQEIVNKLMDFITSKVLDGAIYILPFSCGPCFLMQEQVISHYPDKKILILNVDESKNEMRIKTRIEAFLDILK